MDITTTFDVDTRQLVRRYWSTKEKITKRGPSSIENDANGIEKLLLKNSSKLNKFLHSEVNQLIQQVTNFTQLDSSTT